MDKNYYETALLLASGAVLGQILTILIDMSFSVLSFVPMIVLVCLLGVVSVRTVSQKKGLVKTSVKTRLVTGVWVSLVWELFRRRIIWPLDILKYVMLFVVLYALFKVVQRTWEA